MKGYRKQFARVLWAYGLAGAFILFMAYLTITGQQNTFWHWLKSLFEYQQ